jgi:hypothetical protein
VDRERRLLCFKGKGGRYREVPISPALLGRLGETACLHIHVPDPQRA